MEGQAEKFDQFLSGLNTNQITSFSSCSFCNSKILTSEMNNHINKFHFVSYQTLVSNVSMLTILASPLFEKVKDLEIYLNSINSFVSNIENLKQILQIKTFYLSTRLSLESIVNSILSFYKIQPSKKYNFSQHLKKLKSAGLFPPSFFNCFFDLNEKIGGNIHNLPESEDFFDITKADEMIIVFRLVIAASVGLLENCYSKKTFKELKLNRGRSRFSRSSSSSRSPS